MNRQPGSPQATRSRRPRKMHRKAAPRPDPPRLIAFNKPCGVLTQFTDADKRATLADFIDAPGVYAAGRLDRDSEGLLLLTNDGKLQAHITDPRHKLPKIYWAQVEGQPSEQQIDALRAGPLLKDGPTQPADVEIITEPELWPRDPPVRYRKSVPTTWLAITIREGRNRQLRRMTAALGLPTLRLVRVGIGRWRLGALASGQWHELPCRAPGKR